MSHDQPRPIATSADNEYTLTIDDALSLYAAAGIPRTPRSIQRYCAIEHLTCHLAETEFGEKYLITRASVEKHIAYIKEVTPTTGRDVPRLVATSVAVENIDSSVVSSAATPSDEPRPVATGRDLSRYVERLEGDIDYLRGQLEVKDSQIKEATERARETNVLIAGLQKMLSPLLAPSRDPQREREDGTLS